jgi:hypothetical protein
MKKLIVIPATLAIAVVLAASGLVHAADTTKCTMSFTLKSWSAFYKSSKGQGTITCDNGETAKVDIRAKGGGITFGKSEITDGHGTFSEVLQLEQVLGGYAQSEAHAGASKSVGAQAMTKGEVSLALTGKGKGWDIGVGFGKFTIESRGAGKDEAEGEESKKEEAED